MATTTGMEDGREAFVSVVEIPICSGGCGFREDYCDCSNYDSEGNEL